MASSTDLALLALRVYSTPSASAVNGDKELNRPTAPTGRTSIASQSETTRRTKVELPGLPDGHFVDPFSWNESGMSTGMKINNTLFSIARLVVVALLVGLSFAGCTGNTIWQEEVKLSTGETIKIEREVKHVGGGAAWPQGQGSIPREHIIRFKYPAQTGPLIEWHSTKLTPATYAELPLVLDINADKTWFIFTVLTLGPACDQYLKYQFKNGVWTEVALTDDIGTYPTNLSLAAGSVGLKGLISIHEKVEEMSTIGFRSRLKQVGPKRFECDTGYNGSYPPKGAV